MNPVTLGLVESRGRWMRSPLQLSDRLGGYSKVDRRRCSIIQDPRIADTDTWDTVRGG